MQLEDYRFEYPVAHNDVTAKVREALDQGHGRCVVGLSGIGKTHAVASAVNGAIWATVPAASFAVPRVLADLASQTQQAHNVLQSYDKQGCEAACLALDEAIGTQTLVLDAVDCLCSAHTLDPFDEPDISTLWAGENAVLRDWALARVEKTRTVLIARWLNEPPHMLVARDLDDVPIKLQHSKPDVSWEKVTNRVQRTPAALFLAAATLRLGGPSSISEWLDETEGCGQTDFTGQKSRLYDATAALSRRFRCVAPRALIRLLSMLEAAGEVRQTVIERLAQQDDDLGFALDLAHNLRLLEVRAGRVRLVPYLIATNAVPTLRKAGGTALARRVATALLSSVNDRSSLAPTSALRVLDAHRLQLAVGDFDGALTTARLHVGGLLGYARQLSLNADEPSEFERARRAYHDIRSILEAHPKVHGSKARSYVDHYHGFNGHRAHTLSLGQVADDYDRAIDTWSDNALWHSRRIALAAESGDATQALALQDAGYEAVPEHPRRDAYLRVRTAMWSSRVGANGVAFQLIGGFQASVQLDDIDAVAAQYLRRLCRRWSEGVEFKYLSDGAGVELLFHAPARIYVDRANERWEVSIDYPSMRIEDDAPWTAIKMLAKQLASECRRLVQTPTGRLHPTEVARKGLYLGVVDLANSQIGLPFHTTRWLIGTLSNGLFAPIQADLAAISLAPDIIPTSQRGQFLGRVSVDRTGHPDGLIERLVAVGDGQGHEDLLRSLRRLSEEDHEAA